MPKNIYNLISLLFPAQITPIYFFIILLINDLPSHIPELIIAGVFSSLIQITSLIIYVRIKKLDIFVSNRNERPLLFFIAIVSYLIGFLALMWIHATFIITATMLAYVVNTTAATIINHFEKVSVHTWGISGPAVALLYQYGYFVFALALLLSLVVGFSRVKAKAHTLRQVVFAILVSVPLTFFVVYYLAPSLI